MQQQAFRDISEAVHHIRAVSPLQKMAALVAKIQDDADHFDAQGLVHHELL